MTVHPMFPPGPAADKDRIVYAEDGLKRESSAPCQLNCPAEIDVPSYIALIGQGRYKEAIDLIRMDNPFPWVCGLVCPNPCESWCQRRYLDKALCIKDLKGFAAKMVCEKGPGYTIPAPKNTYSEKIAVIGSGPAGLTAAYFLAWEGYPVTVFEAMPEAGGLLVTGIPEFRLPRRVVRNEVEAIKAMGVEIVLNTPVGGADLTLDHLRKQGYKAFFLGIGAWQALKLGIEGEDQYPQVLNALSFLKDIAFGPKIKPANSVAIVGGGNAAIDTARTCVRLGSQSVSIIYRRTRSEMPAHFEEIIQMAEEGIHVHQLTIPSRIIGSYGKIDFLECVMATLGEPDETGRRRPVPIEGSEYKMPVGAVIAAIGQKPDLVNYPGFGDLELTKWETIKVRSHNQQTSVDDVFAGGDAVTGPKTVVEAIGAGKRAARAIHAYLRGEALPKRQPPRPRDMVRPILMDYHEKAFIQRQEIPLIDLDRRIHTFDQVELGLDEYAAKEEAKRCMRCDICERCGKCVEVCRDRLGVSAIRFHHAGENSLILKDYVHGLPRCIGCGACVNICPTGALQMVDQGDQRLILMSGTIINRIKMEKCEGCGAYYISKVLLKHVEKLVGAPEEAFDRKLCPDCKRIDHAAKMVGMPPDFTEIRRDRAAAATTP
uniref:4Fe-4S dicluster domain-containing protein n=1 Tax=Desulfomonile tiedjei TaxID=2358 RepID=A0A7C4EYR1_9BACT